MTNDEIKTEWNARYGNTERLFIQDPNEILVELAGNLPSGKAIDIGAGEGRNSLWLAERGWDVTAVDLSAVALARLELSAKARNLEIRTVVSDLHNYLSVEDKFDLVVIAYIHFNQSERKRLFDAAAKVISPGGYIFVVGHHLATLGQGGPPQPERLYTEDILRDAFPTLEMVRLERRANKKSDIEVPLVDAVAWARRPHQINSSELNELHA